MSPVKKLLEQFPDEVRHPLVADNPDWENEITPALVELGNLRDANAIDEKGMARIMRVILEICYVKGYQSK